MAKVLNFQEIMLTLQEFWAGQGCLIWQPYYSQVGAGTMNPATALRVLGPEPWRVGYIEPSIRPDDGRYGQNPNRMQMHYQFQVILKPDPGNPQEIYLQSLEALGIDPRQHDIRFVEDNWESPALGAWGLGWEVWLDGQEITQYTYFQQSGGIVLDPVSVELTYGLERIAIALQRVNSFREIQWSPTLTDGDVNLQAEQEHSQYYFELADVEYLRQMYDLFEAEAKACLAKGLVLPAHDYILKCSHTFNVLDTRGAVGVTERQVFFARMRELSRGVAEAYIEQRQRLEFPWLDGSISQTTAGPRSTRQVQLADSEGAQTFLLEIGTEELPVGDLERALAQLREAVPAQLAELRLEHGEVRVMGTPRRLVVLVESLVSRQPDLEQVVKGPPAKRAFDGLGQPTQAAQGFARSKGVPVTELQVRSLEGGEYAVAVVRAAGRPTPEVLAEAIPEVIASINFEKGMRWNSTNVEFSRPIRWLLALYGGQVVPFSYAGLDSSNTTRGLRFNSPAVITLNSPGAYFEALAGQGIALDRTARQTHIRAQVEALTTEVGGDVVVDPSLLSEVTNLVEAPTALRGTFDRAYLELPREVLISVMKKHQRYFPVEKNGELLPYFITIANKASSALGECEGADTIRAGNEHVIRARFADAAYFVHADRKQRLADYLEQLARLTFQIDLGSMLDKSRRVVALVKDLAIQIDLSDQDLMIARRAAELCKADLATAMVVEMTSLQGIMGRYYALESGEPAPVAEAIYEHYLPRFPGDDLPQTSPGLVVGLADRLDSLAGLFAVGLAPTGNKDPFAQRRTAVGLVQNLIAWHLDFDLRLALQAAAAHLPVTAGEGVQDACMEFISERLRNLLLEEGGRYDVVEAVLAEQAHNPAKASDAVRELGQWVLRPDWHTILPAYARCVRITRAVPERYPVDVGCLSEVAEIELYNALHHAEASERQAGAVNEMLDNFVPLIPVINSFFEAVLVMAEAEDVRRNRLGLLQRIVALADGVADFSHLEGF